MFTFLPFVSLADHGADTLHCRTYKRLSPTARAGVGAGIIAWGTAGLYLTPAVEERMGLTPTEEDKAELDKYKPKITAVDKTER
jgi:hypothetical protein